MARRKIAILGGGMAGLAAAYQLTRTRELRALHDVTVYQMGWRLGGKCASGRDALGRNLEHGLHVWFGCYENAFQMLQEVYAARPPRPGSPLRHWTDAVRPQDYTPVGVPAGGRWTYWPLTWPQNDGVPGDGTLTLGPMEILTVMIGWVKEILHRSPEPSPAEAATAAGAPPAPIVLVRPEAARQAARDGLQRARVDALARAGPVSVHRVAELVHLQALSLGRGPGRETELRQIVALADWMKTAFNGTVGAAAVPGSRAHMIRDVLDIFQALVRGVVLDLLLPDRPFESLDEEDLRDWLVRHGADPGIVRDSSVVRVVYDTLFQYADGDAAHPSYAAGTAIGVIMRLLGTYKGAMMWELQAGMGEAVVAPLYQVLTGAGVSFEFFRTVTKLGLSADRRRIQAITLTRQAETRRGPYRPTTEFDGLTCWPSEPFWDQLEHGEDLKAARVDFESKWSAWPDRLPPQREQELRLGTDFDVVVLAMAMGAYKPLNADPGPCDELIAQGGRFADFVNNIGIVPSHAVQLWCDRATGQLGWTSGKAATVAGPEYLDIWADMSQIIRHETWPNVPKPKSLHYLTGTWPTLLYREPAARHDVPALAAAEIRKGAIDWLNTLSYGIWPAACDGRVFDWNVLTDPAGRTGEARFDAQFWRANVDPTECCVLSAAGTTRWRLHPDESGFDNLVLAGEATRHGFNTTTVEGAIMSGMAASRAICGQPATIVGYDFLRRRPSQGPGDGRPGSGRAALPPAPPSTVLGRLGEFFACAAPGTPGVAGQPPAAAAGLPPYISWIGRGAASLAPRGVFSGAKAHMFAVEANASSMQRLADELLNPAGGGAVRYETVVGCSLVTFMDIARCTSDTDAIGWLPGRECAIWVPLLEVRPGRPLATRLVLWSPYIFIDYDIGMLTGREVWGWPKVGARIAVAADLPDHPAAFTCATTIFRDALSPDTPGERAILFGVTGSAPLGPASLEWRDGPGAVRRIVADLLGGVAAEIGAVLGLRADLPAVVLRQVRDTALPGRARLQEIVDSSIRITRFGGGGLLPGRFSLHVTTCASHRIVQDLFGVAPAPGSTVRPVAWAAWAEFDFEALPGRIIASTP